MTDHDAELIDSSGNVIPLRPDSVIDDDAAVADDDTEGTSKTRGPELSSMRQCLREQSRQYRLHLRGKVSASELERRVKALATMFEEHKFLDWGQQIAERLTRLEDGR